MSLEDRLGVELYSQLEETTLAGIMRLVDNSVWLPIPEPQRLLGRTNLIAGGIDRCSIPSMEEVISDAPEVIARIFSPLEIAWARARHSDRPARSLAGAFAVKEAGFKAGGFNYRDLVVSHRSDRSPYIILADRAKEKAARLGVEVYLFGVAHDDNVAEAWVVLLQRVPDEDIDLI